MTRHNLSEHLSWLLSTKPCAPADSATKPTITARLPSLRDPDNTANHEYHETHHGERDSSVVGEIECKRDPSTQIRPDQKPIVQTPADSMARLRAAPTLSSSKPILGTTTLQQHHIDTAPPALNKEEGRPVHKSLSPNRRGPSISDHSHMTKALSPSAMSPTDVEVMDLTSDTESYEGTPRARALSQMAGRKRKSEEYRADLPRKHQISHTRTADPDPAPEISDSDDYQAIDDLDLDNAPSEPPPPYSTVAPRSPVRRAGSSLRPALNDVQPNQKFTANSLVLPRESRPLATAAVPATPSSAPPDFSPDEELLLKTFLLWTADDLSLHISQTEHDHEQAVDDYVNAMAEMDEDECGPLMERVNRLKEMQEALGLLRQSSDRFGVLDLEKRDVMLRMSKALKAGHDHKTIAGALVGIKRSLQQNKVECLPALKKIEPLLLRTTTGRETNHGTAHQMGSSIASSANAMDQARSPLRVQQTQLQPRSDQAFTRRQEKAAVPNQARSMWPEQTAPNKYESYEPNSHFSPPRKVKPFSGPAGKENRNDSHTVDDEFGFSDNLFSTVMGTPPPQTMPDREEDFDDFDDVEQLFDLAENLSNEDVFQGPAKKATTSHVARERLSPNTPKKPVLTKASDVMNGPLMQHRWSHDVKKALSKTFKLRGFRPNQLEAINATLAGKDVFVLMPTGGGKSLCYQLPAIVTSGKTSGITIVISPLLSLMEDQVSHLRKVGIQAFIINGETSKEEKDQIFDAFYGPRADQFIQLLYVTPEMLNKNQRMVDAFRRLHRDEKLARIVIDEAHCVSQWGHDFRPDYKELGQVRQQFQGVPVMALTATATENVKVDVMHNLHIDGCEVFTQSFNRPNLYYEVRHKGKAAEILQEIANTITTKHSKQSGIVYCLSRKTCETVADTLRSAHGIKAHHYHAAMESADKSKVQKMWQAGKYQVIVATIAFGMGIDKPDVRFVIHHSLPKSLEGYYQETGRAGRDGKRSGCYLYYGYQDTKLLRRMIDDGEGSYEQKERQRLMLRKMVQYCENKSDCRRVQVLGYFNEVFARDDCNHECDVCDSTSTFETTDMTEYAIQAIKLVEQLVADDDKLTLLYCVDAFRGSRNAKIVKNSHDQVDAFGSGSGLDRGDAERLFQRLVMEDAIIEHNVFNKAGFAVAYVRRGPKAAEYLRKGKKVLMSMRASSPRGKSKIAGTAAKAAKKSKGASSKAIEYPMSTNVSSPMQAMSSRKSVQSARSRNIINEQRAFDASDHDDEDFQQYSNDSDGFEPVRDGSRPRKIQAQSLGPPITTDEKLDSLGQVHRLIVDEFVKEAKRECQQILVHKSLRSVPFSDTVLREMAINFTTTPGQMSAIPGADPEKVRTYCKPFIALVKRFQESYKDMMRNQDEPIADPNHETVINLVSDDDEQYGSFGESDLESEGPDQRSGYFSQQRNAEVAAFNAALSQTQARAMPPPKKSYTRREGESSKPAYGGGRGGRGKGPKRGSGGSWRGRGAYGGVKKKGGARKTSATATASAGLSSFAYDDTGRGSSSKRRTGGISMMPT